MQKVNALGSWQRMLIFSIKATIWRRQRGEHLPHRSLAESGKNLKHQLIGEHKEKRGFEAALPSRRNVIKGQCLTKVTLVTLNCAGFFCFCCCHNTMNSPNRILQPVSIQGSCGCEFTLPLCYSVWHWFLQFWPLFHKNNSCMTEDHLDRFESEMEICEIMNIFARGEIGYVWIPSRIQWQKVGSFPLDHDRLCATSGQPSHTSISLFSWRN